MIIQLTPSVFLRLRIPPTDVVVIDKSHYKELLSAPENRLSFTKSSSRGLQLRYTFSSQVEEDNYHTMVVKKDLNRHIPKLMPTIVDELLEAFGDAFRNVGTGTANHLFQMNIRGYLRFRMDTPRPV